MSARPPAVGAYLVDESPPGPPWVGRMRRVADDGRYVLITATGYEWPARPDRLRPATGAERATFEQGVDALHREVAFAVGRMTTRAVR
ncbi:hypothetical protein [Streptomyces sulphureus]|uniref:hypothetical protein n=1 Tax=Streptomyces sulphureus TaxID=47758 RepID=UPI000365657A|nr:hypothetical protein [Streptomyces sulphureus]